MAPTLSISTLVKVNIWEAPCVVRTLWFTGSLLPKSISSRMGTLFYSCFIFILTGTHSGCSIHVSRHKIKCESTLGEERASSGKKVPSLEHTWYQKLPRVEHDRRKTRQHCRQSPHNLDKYDIGRIPPDLV